MYSGHNLVNENAW